MHQSNYNQETLKIKDLLVILLLLLQLILEKAQKILKSKEKRIIMFKFNNNKKHLRKISQKKFKDLI